MKNLLSLLSLQPALSGESGDLPELRLQAASSRSGAELLPALLDAIDRACGWVLHRQMISPVAMQLQVETQGRALLDLYAAMLEQGLELSRDSHQVLAERCSCAHLHRGSRRSIVSLNLEVSLAAEMPSLAAWGRPVLA